MKKYGRLVLSWGVQLAGGRPYVVLPLARALEKSATEQTHMLRQERNRKMVLSSEALRILILVAVAVGSILLAALVAANPGELRPSLAIIVLVTVHYLMIVHMVVSSAGPGLLMEDDSKTIGWWPVTRREIMLARLGMIFKPALEITAVMIPIPLLVVAVKMKPPVLISLLLGTGLLVQTVAVTFGVVVLLSLLVRWLGRRQAQRLAGLVSDGNIMVLALPAFFFGETIVQGLTTYPWILNLLPPTWFAAWGDPGAGTIAVLRALGGLGISVALVYWGTRVAVPTTTAPAAVEKTPSRWHFSKLVCWMIRPWFRGPEGRVVHLLLEAHLREDWRFMGNIAGFTMVIGFMFFGLGHRSPVSNDEAIGITALARVGNTHFPLIMAGSMLYLATYSNMARSMWVVALGSLNTFRLLTAQRGIIHGLITTPVVILYAIRAWQIGAPWWVIGLDGLLLAMELELILLALQPLVLTMPFSRRYTKDQLSQRIWQAVLSIGLSIVCLVANVLYGKFPVFRYVLWTGLPLILILSWWLVRRRTRGRRLHMDVIVGA